MTWGLQHACNCVCLQLLLDRPLGPRGLDLDYIIFRDPSSPKLLGESMHYQLHMLLHLAWLPGIPWSWVFSCLSGTAGGCCDQHLALPIVVRLCVPPQRDTSSA